MLSPYATARPAAGNRLQSGAFDLPSVLIGVAVVAILAIGVMAAVFGVIPWAQDRAAQQDLAAVNTSQGAAYAQGGSFKDKGSLVGAGWLGADTPAKLVARAGSEGECYVAVVTSKTGKRFVATSEDPAPRALADTDTWCSGSLIEDTQPVMVSTWDTSLAANCQEITLPLSAFKGTVNWGDGSSDATRKHAYTRTGSVTITVNGTFTAWGGGSEWPDANCLVSVDRWGATGTTNLSYAFYDADNLKHVAAIPGTTVNLGSAFRQVGSDFTLGYLDTSRATSLALMFGNTKLFNQPLDLDTSSAVNLASMFSGASVFNQPLDFDTSRATNMSGMFSSAYAFNQPVNFDTTNVRDMSSMFYAARAFNQPVPFDTSNVTTMNGMFSYTEAFDQQVDFDTSAVTNMSSMFSNAAVFNRPVRFDTSQVVTTSYMFYWAREFNRPLDWDTSKVTTMELMFTGAGKFSQDLSTWNVKEVAVHSNFADAAFPAAYRPKFRT